ncbi:hypothetical protein QCA50_020667 [Cerrena zonata]|uniref:Uncharacterized protein n=1 Tax=Cerrena zonata TaxID=2478898 RepID=A0AAW0F8R1_9APHY
MSSSPSNDSHDLNDLSATLLSSSAFLLTYAIPLLVLSTVLTFSGSFLTLDRTRALPRPKTFDPENLTRRLRSWFVLEGGIGGILLGYAFGVHIATMLSIMIPNVTSAAPLRPPAFLAVWLCSVLLTSVSSGRWKYAARTVAGLIGYSTLALSISVIVHPTRLTRIVLAAVFTALGTIACLLPFPAISHTPVRIAASATGAFGVILSVSLFAHVPAWADVWERFWVDNDINWGSSREKGLSAAYCFLLVTGVICDWALHKYYGEDPDEKWNQYLSDYSLNLPNNPRRAGDFHPPLSLWDQITNFFSSEETKIHSKLQKPVTVLHKNDPQIFPSMLGDPGGAHKYSPISGPDQKVYEVDLGLSRKSGGDAKWEEFWRDVKSQAVY